MPNTDFDWTFDSIPTEDGAEDASAPPAASPRQSQRPSEPSPQPITLAPRARAPRRRRWLLPALVLTPLAVAVLAAFVTYAFGWQRLRGQLAAEITYEDEQSRLGNVNAVMALHAWGNQPWQTRRTAEVAAGLAAPLPASSLLPVDEPPRLIALDTFGERLFAATVVREYTDSAGQVYRFEYTQRYFNSGPGLWQRLPPDEARLAATASWGGQRLAATYPVVDEAWMAAALPEIDGYLSEACAVWACPAQLSLPVVFTGELDDLPDPHAGRRALTLDGGYPLIFDTAFRPPRYPRLVVLASPQLAGVPHDEAASRALVRALAADLLGQLAADVAGLTRARSHYFLDALVARAEERLGLTPIPAPRLSAADYAPVSELWHSDPGGTVTRQLPEVGPRLQALWFLNAALEGQDSRADARLLAGLRLARGVEEWLASGAQIDAAAAIARWEGAARAQAAALSPARWDELEGLAYVCGGEGWIVSGGAARQLPREAGQAWLPPVALSPDGTYAAAPLVVSDTQQLVLLALDDFSLTVIAGPAPYPVGWAANGNLVYMVQTTSTTGERLISRLRVRDMEIGSFQLVTGMEIITQGAGLDWSEDWQALAVTLTDSAALAEDRTLPAVVLFGKTLSLTVPAWEGYSPSLSPDGRWLAYITRQAAGALRTGEAPRVVMLDLSNRTAYDLLEMSALPGTARPDEVTALRWSPDGRRLALVAQSASSSHLYDLRLAPGAPTRLEAIAEVRVPAQRFGLLGFSAGGEYLALAAEAGARQRLVVVDLAALRPLAFEANMRHAAWSPSGHRLAIANAAGLFAADPTSGVQEWIAAGDCVPSWRGLN